jgi:hypothetical protein
MIQLKPNNTYRLRYLEGQEHNAGDVKYFRTLDDLPEAKHLIRVKDLSTGDIVSLIDLLSHPWDRLEEYTGLLPFALFGKGNDIIKVAIGLLTSLPIMKVLFGKLNPYHSEKEIRNCKLQYSS